MSYSKEIGKHIANEISNLIAEETGHELTKIAQDHGFTHKGYVNKSKTHQIHVLKHPSGHEVEISHFHDKGFGQPSAQFSVHKVEPGSGKKKGVLISRSNPDRRILAHGHSASHLQHELGKVSGK